MSNLVSVQIEMNVRRSDCLVFELPKGITLDEFKEMVDKAENRNQFINHFIDSVGIDVFAKTNEYPKLNYQCTGAEDGEVEILQFESGDLFSESESE